MKENILNYLSAFNYRSRINMQEPYPTNEDVVKKVFKMAWPSTFESFFIALISAVDTMMVAGLGHEAISAVGVTGQPRMILLALIMALNMGVMVVVSRRRGQGRKEEANHILRNSIIISFVLSLVLNSLGYIFSPELLRFAGANADYIDMSIAYFRIICIGNFFYSLSLTMTAAQRGAGNTKISMTTNLSANVVNIILNYLLINGIWIFPRLEIVGAALATAIGNGVAFLIALYSVSKKDSFLHLNIRQNWKITTENLKTLFTISYPSMIEQIFLRIGFFTFTKQVFELGTYASSTHQIGMTVMHMSFAIGDGLAIASTALVGQSLGQKRPDLAKLFGKSVQHLGRVVAVTMAIIIFLIRFRIIQLFTDVPQIVQPAQIVMTILSIILFFQMSQVIAIGSLRGAGDVKFVALLSMVSIMIVRPLLTYILAYKLGYGIVGAWFGMFADQLIRWSVSLARYNSGKWVNLEL